MTDCDDRFGRDAAKKSTLLSSWLEEFTDFQTIKLLDQSEGFDPVAAHARLAGVSPEPSVYVLFIEVAGVHIPIYVGKANDPIVRWKSHLTGLRKGMKSYAKWRAALVDTQGKVIRSSFLLVVPLTIITRPPVSGFPISAGSIEYQLVGLIQSAFPGRLLNMEGKGR